MTERGRLLTRFEERLREAGARPELRQQAEDAARHVRERWQQAQEAQTAMRAVTATAVSPRREVSVTAAWGGRITEVSLPTAAYKRMPTTQFTELLRTTIAEAQQRVDAAVADLLAPTLPAGVDARALLAGDTELEQLFPASSSDWFTAAASAGPAAARPAPAREEQR